MPTEWKYSLTRVCLKTGRLTLPLTMLELFPKEGTVRAFDTKRGSDFELLMESPRIVSGLADFFHTHGLEVNDAVLIKLLEDGRYAFTPMPRPRRPDYARPEAAQRLVDRLIEIGAPLSEAEIRAMFSDLPRDLDLAALLRRDGRLEKRQGRWGLPSAPAPGQPEGAKAKEGEMRDKGRRATVTPYSRGVVLPGDLGLNSDQEAPADPSLHSRARDALVGFGYRVEALSHGQLVAHADMGRQQYSVLVYLHPEEARLDWAGLMERRRETGATYLAIFGAHRDLLRLHSPAGLAQASLWSWEALARAVELVRAVPVSPFDLESHFKRDGLFEGGLRRFERTIAERVRERGNFSVVLARLATMKAPTIFLLEDVVAEAEMPRDQALKVLELLSRAPFHMVERADDGEFCLRYSVAQGLLHLSNYALSLRERMPSRRTEKLKGAPGFVFDGPAEEDEEADPAPGATDRDKD